MNQQLIFVYNAKSGFLNSAKDMIHKSVKPSTYPCKLCALTYNGAAIDKIWKSYIKQLPIDSVFLHKDEFEKKYQKVDISYPAILLQSDSLPETLINSQELENINSLEELIYMTNKKLEKHACPECGLHYYDEKMAKKCQNWCGQNKSCNLEIIAHSIENQRKSKG